MKPLTIEQLKALEVGDWVWYKFIGYDADSYRQIRAISNDGIDFVSTAFSTFDTYGTEWLAYKNKEQAEEKDSGQDDNELLALRAAIVDFCYKIDDKNFRETFYKRTVGNRAQTIENMADLKVKGEIVELPFIHQRKLDNDWEVVSIHPDGFIRIEMFCSFANAERRLAELKGEK